MSTLRVSLGSLFFLCFLRYPFVLLLAWASLNVCIGSSLASFNGNNLDMLLIFPLLCLLAVLPWKEIRKRMPGLIWLGFVSALGAYGDWPFAARYQSIFNPLADYGWPRLVLVF